jgi:hypothetical protein
MVSRHGTGQFEIDKVLGQKELPDLLIYLWLVNLQPLYLEA